MLENYQNWAISSQAPQECGEGSTTRVRSPDRTVKPHECATSVKPCKKCGSIVRYADGKCKACANERARKHYAKNKHVIHARHAEYSCANAEKKRINAARWARENRARRAEIWMSYYTAKMNAMPTWADREAIKSVYAEARRISKLTGVQHHVDHVIPLQGEMVSGLHVHFNLRVITASENASKKNRFTEDNIV